jgi:hypothetical protein
MASRKLGGLHGDFKEEPREGGDGKGKGGEDEQEHNEECDTETPMAEMIARLYLLSFVCRASNQSVQVYN